MARRLPIYQVDAFAVEVFAGNPAAVCPLDAWLPDHVLQAIAAENNLSETAFLVAGDGDYHLRWFTPTVEVDLCGHATLASAFVIATRLAPATCPLRFRTRSGMLEVTRDGDLFRLDFPAMAVTESPQRSDALAAALGEAPLEVWQGVDLMAVYGRVDQVTGLRPDMARLRALGGRGVIATAPGDDCDFVSRFFAPAAGIPEDPVTGSAHCILTPYWARRLDRNPLRARQVSQRGGELLVEDAGERVYISGRAVLYLEGSIWV